MPARSDVLDVLRAVAVLLVLHQHQSAFAPLLRRITWSGVDLFFVLSGYLVTGLLIRERDTHGNTQVGRFLARRAFKIYPAFWAMIATTVVANHLLKRPAAPTGVYWELAFLQNYGPGLWVSTWSLAVEEHFYLGMAGLFLWLDRRAHVPEPRTVLRVGVALLVGIFALRCLTVWLVPPELKLVRRGTHVRIDGLVCGALIAYAHHHRAALLAALVERHRLLIGALSAAFIGAVFVAGATLGDGAFVRTVGYTLLYLAYAGILLLALHRRQPSGWLTRGLVVLGRHSYGIYIWHLPFVALGLEPLTEAGLVPPAVASWPGTYFVVTILGGILLARAIEMPFLRLRERWVPARGRAPAVVPAARVQAGR